MKIITWILNQLIKSKFEIMCIAILIAFYWHFGFLDNIFSEYKRQPSRCAMVIHNEEDYNNYKNHVLEIADSGAKFGGAFSGCGIMELTYYPKKTSMLYFWE